MRRSRFPLASVCLLALFAAGGCASSGISGTGEAPAAAQKKPYRFDDIPVHPSLSLKLNESFIFETPSTRAGRLVYIGLRNYENILHFYRTRMKDHGWRLVSSFERAEANITFQKPGWVANIIIRPGAINTRVVINFGPQGSKEK